MSLCQQGVIPKRHHHVYLNLLCSREGDDASDNANEIESEDLSEDCSEGWAMNYVKFSWGLLTKLISLKVVSFNSFFCWVMLVIFYSLKKSSRAFILEYIVVWQWSELCYTDIRFRTVSKTFVFDSSWAWKFSMAIGYLRKCLYLQLILSLFLYNFAEAQ